MKKLILITSVLLIAVFAVAYLYFSNLSTNSNNSNKALAIIPQDAPVIFKFTSDKSFYEVFRNYPLFNAIIGNKKQTELTCLKNIFLNNKQFSEHTEGGEIFLSLHPSIADSVEFLWLMPLKKAIDVNDLQNFIKDNKGISTLILNKDADAVLEITINGLQKKFYLHAAKGLAAGSFSKSLLVQSINKNLPKISGNFIREIRSSDLKNENSLANIFINYETCPAYISHFFRQRLNGKFSMLNNFKGFSNLGMNYKSDALMFNGITKTDTTSVNYINLFLHQQPVKNPIKKILPQNTANFIAYGLSNYPEFFEDLKKLFITRKEWNKLSIKIKQITKETGINPQRDIKKLWSAEFMTFQLSAQEQLGAIRVKNGSKLQFLLEPLSSAYSENIRHFNYPDFLYYYYGDPFKQFAKPYFTIIDNHLIIANSPETVQGFLDNYRAERLLYKTPEFFNLNQTIAEQSNIMIFIHVKNSGSNIKSLLKPKYAHVFFSDDFGFKNFYGISYQLTSDGGHFFSNFYAAYKQPQPASANNPNLIESTAVKTKKSID